MWRNASMIPNIQFAIAPFAPNTTQKTPRMAAIAEMTTLNVISLFMANPIIVNVRMVRRRSISNLLRPTIDFFSTVRYLFIAYLCRFLLLF